MSGFMTVRMLRLHVLLLTVCSTAFAEGDLESRVALPSDPRATVIELFESRSGVGSGRARRTLVVTADGRVRVAAGNGVDRETRTRISEDELTALLSEVVARHRFFECGSEEIEQEVERYGREAGLDWRFPNATTTIIRIRTAEGTHEVRCTAAELLAERFPDATLVHDFNGVLQRLQNLIAVTQIGGSTEAQRLCDIANSELRITGGRRQGVTARDIQFVREDRQGLRFVQFLWDSNEGSDRRQSLISVFESQDSPAQVTITPLPRRKR